MTKRRSKPRRKNRNPKGITVSLAADVIKFLDEAIEGSDFETTRSRVLEECVRYGQAMVTADEILQALDQLQRDRTDHGHLERCRRLVDVAAALIDETRSQVLIAVTVPLDAEIKKIDHEWLRDAVDGAADTAKKEPVK